MDGVVPAELVAYGRCMASGGSIEPGRQPAICASDRLAGVEENTDGAAVGIPGGLSRRPVQPGTVLVCPSRP